MAADAPATTLDGRFSAEDAKPVDWSLGRDALSGAGVYWLSTVRADGRPHVTPLLAVWSGEAMHFCTGPNEQKARNLGHSSHVVLTTGTNALDEGLDVVVEGRAVRVTDDAVLHELAEQWEVKYGSEWHFDVRNGCFVNPGGGDAHVFRVAPTTVFGFGKTAPYSQTRWRFTAG